MQAQNPLSYRIFPDDIYLSSTVYFVFQDSKGFIWLCTDAGVYKYNSYDFEHFSTANGLPDNEIFRVYEDKKGRIWFMSLNGKPSFYFNEQLYTSSNNKLLSEIKFSKMMISECEDEEGNLYISSKDNMMYKIDRDDRVSLIKTGRQTNLLWVYEDSVYTIPEHLFFRSYNPRGDYVINTVYVGVKNIIYRSTDSKNFTPFTTLPEECEEIIYLKVLNDTSCYVGTRNGLFILNLQNPESNKHYFRGFGITCVEKDFEGNIWLTTLKHGVHVIPSLDVIKFSDDVFPVKNITCIEKDSSNNLWLGMSNNNYAVITPDGRIFQDVLESQTVLDISRIRHFNEATWIASKAGVLRIINGRKKYYQIYANDIHIEEPDNVFIGVESGLKFNFNIFESQIDYLLKKNQSEKEFSIVNARCNAIIGGDKGEVWFGTSQGLFCYKDELVLEMGKLNPLFNSFIRDLVYDSKTQRLFVATNNNGVLVVKKGNLEFSISSANGLPYNDCYALKIDSVGNLWIGASNVLVKLDAQKIQPNSNFIFSKANFYATRVFDIEIVRDKLYLATEEGLIAFSGKDIFTQYIIPPLISITDFKVNNVSHIMNSEKNFPYFEDDINISYSGISYTDRQNLQYEYQLEGYDTTWQKTIERNIIYNSLSPGKYLFKVRALNNSGIQSQTEIMSFYIGRPFWQTWWFYAGGFSLISSIIYFSWRKRLANIKAKFTGEKTKIEVEKKLIELEHKVLRLQMNPHFIFNTLNSIKGYYAEHDSTKANEYISKFSKLLRTILENTEQVISLDKETETLNLYLELMQLRYQDMFNYTIQIEDGIDAAKTGIPAMLLQPFLENSIIHGIIPKGFPGLLNISFKKENSELVCSITDNGIGRNAATLMNKNKEHHSMATQVVQEFLHTLNSNNNSNQFNLIIHDLFDTQNQASGTQVIIRLPFINII